LRDPSIHKAHALVVEPQATMRNVLSAQLRDLGVGQITAVKGSCEARMALEQKSFDIVLCSREFEGSNESGQDLLDELWRENQLSHSTVFIMLCDKVAYHQVVEAAESALDGIIVRPCSATQLQARLFEARKRKRELAPVLQALDSGQDEQALALAMRRWVSQQPYGAWCGRLAGELLLRLSRPADALKVFETLAGVAGAPWALLGAARAQLAAGHLPQAQALVQRVLQAEPGNADAHDLDGRLLIEQCQFDRALQAYQRAVEITPSCLLRNQHVGALAFYQGQARVAAQHLSAAVSLGVQSKLFDALTLALLGLLRADTGDLPGLRSSAAQLAQYRQRFAGSLRLLRLEQGVQVLLHKAEGRAAESLDLLRRLSATAGDDAFDLEAANLLLGLWARTPEGVRLGPEHEALVRRIGLRFCTSRAISEVLMGAARRDDTAVAWLQACQQSTGAVAEKAMEHFIAGDTSAALALLLDRVREHPNAKLIEQVLALGQRAAQAAGVSVLPAMQPALDEARQLQASSCRAANHIAGIQRSGRSPGGIQLRMRKQETAHAAGA
jgi:tetratricopeptide (TPR) repeat protein